MLASTERPGVAEGLLISSSVAALALGGPRETGSPIWLLDGFALGAVFTLCLRHPAKPRTAAILVVAIIGCLALTAIGMYRREPFPLNISGMVWLGAAAWLVGAFGSLPDSKEPLGKCLRRDKSDSHRVET